MKEPTAIFFGGLPFFDKTKMFRGYGRNISMDRYTCLRYLKDVRDLELARHKIIAEQNQIQAVINDGNGRANRWGVDWDELLWGCVFLAISFMLILAGILVQALSPDAQMWQRFWLKSMVPVFCIIAGLTLFFILSAPRLFEFFQDVIRTSSHNRKARKFGKQWTARSSGLAGSLAYYEEQEQIVCDLLRQAYSMNILPQPYRNLSAVHYIYTYMASSQETLSDTLLHAHIERGIQQISTRMDHLTSQCNQLISQSRSMSQQLSYVQSQNAQLMNYCNRVNTYLLTARYLQY